MDYSASIHEHDGDHPAGASPWANSPATSPKRTRPAFDDAVADPLGSGGFQYSPSNGPSRDNGGFGAADATYPRADTASTNASGRSATAAVRVSPQHDTSRLTTEQPWQSPQLPLHQSQQHQPPLQPQHHQQYPQQQQQQQRRQQPQQQPRLPYQQPPSRQQPARRPTQQQHRLQAKITGLERTGRKDSILKFDVHV